jgi:glycosyltransferase involved in cell wall biosynthesis
VGAVSEEVNNENGWLIAPGNKPSLKAVLIDAIECSDGTLIAKKRISIQKIKDNFLWDDVVNKTLNEIKQVT